MSTGQDRPTAAGRRFTAVEGHDAVPCARANRQNPSPRLDTPCFLATIPRPGDRYAFFPVARKTRQHGKSETDYHFPAEQLCPRTETAEEAKA